MSRKYTKTVDFSEQKMVDSGDFLTFEGLASTFDRDLVGDVIMPGAFTDSIQRSKQKGVERGKKAIIPALFNHDPDKPIGRFVELRETENGLFAKGELNKRSTLVSGIVIPAMEIEAITSMSIGFRIDQRRFEGDTRIIEKLTLFEASLVTFPANPAATVESYKSIGLTVDDLEHTSVRDIERHFLEGNPVSRKLAVKISTMLKGIQRDAEPALQRDAGESEVENPILEEDQVKLLLSLRRRPDASSSPQSVRTC